jgi:hypothetical protein
MLKKILILLSVGVLVIFMSAFVLAQQDTTPPPPPSSGASQVQSNVAANSQAGTEKSTDAAATQPQQEPVSVWAILGSVAFLILVLGAVLAYMFYLQRKFLKACEEENQLPIFLNAPAGLPPGTVRNVLIFLTVVFLLFLVTLQAFRVAPNFIESFLSFLESTNGWVIFSILILSLVVGGFFWYMFTLQKKFLKACEEEDQLNLFSNAPAGLPVGSVRSILTLMIIIFALYLFAIQAFRGDGEIKFPDALAAILSAIIGFYFGSRSASKKDEDKILDESREQLKEAKEKQYEGKAESVVNDISSKLKTAQAVMNFLPDDLRKKYSPTLNKVTDYVGKAKGLLENDAFSKAVDQAGSALNVFKKDNPIKDIVSKTAKSFGAVVSGIPPLAIVGAVVSVSGVLAGVAYNRWRARILNAPFSPTVAPLKLVDPDTGYILTLGSPILKEAFKEQLEGQDRPFLEKITQDFLQKETDEIWPEYQTYFDSFATFEDGVQQFRVAAATNQLEGEIDPTLFAEVGGYKAFMEMIDRIRGDAEAGEDLDLLMEVADNLKKTETDEPLHKIFQDARKEIEES